MKKAIHRFLKNVSLSQTSEAQTKIQVFSHQVSSVTLDKLLTISLYLTCLTYERNNGYKVAPVTNSWYLPSPQQTLGRHTMTCIIWLCLYNSAVKQILLLNAVSRSGHPNWESEYLTQGMQQMQNENPDALDSTVHAYTAPEIPSSSEILKPKRTESVKSEGEMLAPPSYHKYE